MEYDDAEDDDEDDDIEEPANNDPDFDPNEAGPSRAGLSRIPYSSATIQELIQYSALPSGKHRAFSSIQSRCPLLSNPRQLRKWKNQYNI